MGAYATHGQLLANTIGHGAGVLLFGIVLALLVRRRTARTAAFASALALLWNLSSLAGLGLASQPGIFPALVDAAGFAALSFLPALLLQLCLERHSRTVITLGYAFSTLAAALHTAELFLDARSFHQLGVWTIAAGFAALTAISIVQQKAGRRLLGQRLAGSMALFLLAVSMSHFGFQTELAWPFELILHQAGIPLALVVLLQDVRFVLLDAFLRFLANVLLAGLFVGFLAFVWISIAPASPLSPFSQGLLLLAGILVLVLYAVLRTRLQRLLTHIIFRQPDIAQTRELLRNLAAASQNEEQFLRQAASVLAACMDASLPAPGEPAAMILPLRLAHGALLNVRLGERSGGRRYLSEDIEALSELTAYIIELCDNLRETELRRLVSQAELRALQAQIHPHFLFNALNTLYGVIPKQAATARRMVLNLSDLFRYFLRPEQTIVTVEEELRIVEAYIEIEKLRLANRLTVEISLAQDAQSEQIPMLSIQPLVENAIKHGIARNPTPGRLSISIHLEPPHLIVRVQDTGSGAQSEPDRSGTGTGLENVRRRLHICYGADASLVLDSSPAGSTVLLRLPSRCLVEIPQ
ncbi:MAG: histidine kinase [Acidobacteriia bacterium]|nr:histidine kinase [Terriglobia bacterium]